MKAAALYDIHGNLPALSMQAAPVCLLPIKRVRTGTCWIQNSMNFGTQGTMYRQPH